MKKLRISGFILFISIFSFGIMITNCTKKDENTKNAEEKPSVVTTTGMIADAAKNIGGNLIDVTALMGAGVDPHLYKASAKDVDRLAKAQLILYGGLHLEGKMSDVLKKFGELKPTLAVAECIPEEKLLGGENQGLHDPHVWFDVALWMVAVDAVRDSLVSLLPEDAAAIEANYTEYVAKLAKLHVYMKEKTAEIPEDMRIMITAHDAFEYFGRAYGFEVKGLQGISTVSEAGTRDVQDLASYIAKKKVPAIFVESSVPKKNVEALQAAVHARGWDVEIGGELFSDAMGDSGTFEGTYVGMLTHNINTIAGALSKK
ncbi:MAG TPA: zinc ABC transporter solute-binding protein [Treponema sp.]|nr:zinc ABC transporter solute-binding protein [Treponema sp.]